MTRAILIVTCFAVLAAIAYFVTRDRQDLARDQAAAAASQAAAACQGALRSYREGVANTAGVTVSGCVARGLLTAADVGQ